MKSICKLAILICLISVNSQAERLTDDELQIEKARLDAICETAREIFLAPEREKLINDCVENQNKELQYCTRYYRDWGDRINYPNGNVKFATYYDIPECEKAFEFRKEIKFECYGLLVLLRIKVIYDF